MTAEPSLAPYPAPRDDATAPAGAGQGASTAAAPDPRRPFEVSRGLFDRHQFTGALRRYALLYLKIASECRGQSPWWRGGSPQPLSRLVEETGMNERTLQRAIRALEAPRPAPGSPVAQGSRSTPGSPEASPLALVPRPYLRVWRCPAGLVILVVERISFESGRGRKADTHRFLERTYVPDALRGDKPVAPGVTKLSPHPLPPAVPQREDGQGALPLGPVCAVQSLPLVKPSSAPTSFGLRSAAGAAPAFAQQSTTVHNSQRRRALRALRRVLADYPGLPPPAAGMALAGALQAHDGAARGVGDEALAHGFRCALDAVARYASAGGAGGPALRGSIAALVAGVIPGEALRWNAARAELAHDALKAEERELAGGFMDRLARLVNAGLEYGEACAIAARPERP